MKDTFTNPAVLVERKFFTFFHPKEVTVIDLSTGARFLYYDGLADDTAIKGTDGTLIASKGVTTKFTSIFAPANSIVSITKGATTTIVLGSVEGISLGDKVLLGAIVENSFGKPLNGITGLVKTVTPATKTIVLDVDTSARFASYAGGGYAKVVGSCCSSCCSVNKIIDKAGWEVTLGTAVLGSASKQSVVYVSRMLNILDGTFEWNRPPNVKSA